MIKRDIESTLLHEAKYFSAVAILGPRQSGKTTLAKNVFPNHKYISFEDIIGIKEYIQKDPKGFLQENKNEHGIILDEFQHAPLILSYIQLAIDEEHKPGYFILTGSQNFLMNEAISQTLAGRISILTLLPLTIDELSNSNNLPQTPAIAIHKGFYPGIYSKNIPSNTWYKNYVQTYIERDARQLKNISDLLIFQKFIKLCAGRIGQILNITSLANDCGITQITANSWLSILQASYIIYLLQPHHKNFSKRLIKSPKLFFYDTGLASFLLGIETVEQLKTHYMRGGLFECMIISDIVKRYYNNGKVPKTYFWRDHTGHEIDCLIDKADNLVPIEIKSGSTINIDFFNSLEFFKKLSKNEDSGYLVYSGDENQNRTAGKVVSWRNLNKIDL